MTTGRSLDSFLPMDRRQALAAGSAQLPDTSVGAVLFVDLTGFTKLTEGLVRQLGPRRGVEELSAHISRIYEGLLQGVHRHQGSVITFIGDALVVWFGSVSEADAASRAASAAAEMQRAMADFSAVEIPGGEAVSFASRIGLSVGSARRFLVGEPGKGQFEVLAGRTVDAAVSAESAAEPGETVCTADFAKLVAGPVLEWRSGASELDRYAVIDPAPGASADPWPEPAGDLSVGATGPWLPAAVVSRLATGTEFLSELRTAVPLFVQFEGIDFDDGADAGTNLDEFVDGVQEILEPLEGTLLQVIAGDKGSHLYVVFGAPVGHDDDESRAAAAALSIRDYARRLDFIDHVRIGLNSGRVFAGLYGASSRLSYAVIGDPVNLAARLMGRAEPGQVLLTRRTAERGGPALDVEPVGEIRVKGRDAPVDVLELKGRVRTTRTTEEADMIGRRDELSRLLAVAEEAQKGQTRILTVEGEAGIGKSRLLDEAVRRLSADGVCVVRGYADVVERRREYHAWRGVFAGLLDVRHDDNPAERLDAVRAALEALSVDEVRRLPLLSPILDLGLEDNELTRQMTGEIRANNTIAILTSVLQAAAHREPLALILEDAHWFDTPSWSLLHAVRRTVDRVLVVVSSRPHREDAAEQEATEYDRLLSDGRCQRLELGALEPREAAALAARRLGVDSLPEAIETLVVERSEGHPLFAQEIVLSLRDAGTLIVEEGTATIAEGATVESSDVPDTIEGVVTGRLDRLGPDEQLVAKVASVIGRTFDVSTLRHAHPSVSEDDLERHLEALVARALLEPPSIPSTYVFSHSIIRDVTYATLLYAQRRSLHRSVAESMESVGDGEQAERFSVLAHHWEYADEPPRAVDYLEKAGEHAVNAYANAEAITFFGRARALVEAHGDRIPDDPADRAFRIARWRRLTGEARNGMGEFDRSYEDMRAALSLLGRPEPGPGGMTARLFGELARQWSHRRIRPGLLARKANRRAALEAARVYKALVYPYYVSGNWLGGLYANWYMLNAVERYGGEESGEGLLSQAKTNVAGAWLNILHNRKIGDRYLLEAREQARDEGDMSSLAWTYLLEGMVRVFNSSLDEAKVALDEACRLYTDLGDPRRMVDTNYTLATWHFFTGDPDESISVSRELLRAGRARDDVESQLLALGQEALCHVFAGRYGEAVERVDESQALSKPGESMAEQIFAAGVGTLAHARQGDPETAVESAEYTLELLDSVKISNLAIEGFSCLAEALLAMREAGLEVPSAARPLKALKKNADALSRVHRPRAWLLLGWQLALDGKQDKARRLFQRCVEQARETGLPYEEARASLELARVAGPGAEADALLAVAEAGFTRLDMPWELERVRITRIDGAGA